MNATQETTSTPVPVKKRRGRARAAKKPPAPPPAAGSLGKGVSPEAGRRAAVILEVLAGERTPRQAAAALSISVNYFYLLERHALRGLLRACEPQPKGPPPPSAERKLEVLERELNRCRRECQRQAALVRATQRTVGLPIAASATPVTVKAKTAGKETGKPSDPNGPRRRRRKPTARALRVAQTVRRNSAGSDSASEIKQSANLAEAAANVTAHDAAPPFPEQTELEHGG